MIRYLKRLYTKWKKEREFKKKIKELKKRDPFNYTNF